MTLPFYPSHLRSLFTDRERELELLRQATASLADGHPRHLAFFGLRRIGKTLLLLEHAARLLDASPSAPVRPVYLDFEELATSPELFSRRYIGLVTFWTLTQGQGDRESFLTPTGLLGVTGDVHLGLEPTDAGQEAMMFQAQKRTQGHS